MDRAKGNKEALEKGFYDEEEARFIESELFNRFSKRGSATCEGERWYIQTDDGEVFAVYPCTGPMSIEFEEL